MTIAYIYHTRELAGERFAISGGKHAAPETCEKIREEIVKWLYGSAEVEPLPNAYTYRKYYANNRQIIVDLDSNGGDIRFLGPQTKALAALFKLAWKVNYDADADVYMKEL